MYCLRGIRSFYLCYECDPSRPTSVYSVVYCSAAWGLVVSALEIQILVLGLSPLEIQSFLAHPEPGGGMGR